MNSLEHVEQMLLKDLELFPDEILSYLEVHNILTVGHFLGVTCGLQEQELLNEMNLHQGLIDEFLGALPTDLIEKYREPKKFHPTGLCKDNSKIQNHDKEEENLH